MGKFKISLSTGFLMCLARHTLKSYCCYTEISYSSSVSKDHAVKFSKRKTENVYS